MTLDIFKDFDELEDQRQHARRPVLHTEPSDPPCSTCRVVRSVHVRPDGYGGENGLIVRKDGFYAGQLCLFRR